MAAPTCSLTISGITDDGLPRWQANTAYWGLSDARYPDLIVDSNGNYQAVYAFGTSTGSEPIWGTNVGDFTNDGGSLIWRCVQPIEGNGYQPLAYTKAAVKFGTSFTLNWTSTDADTVSISGIGTVAASGSMVVTPSSDRFYTGAFNFDNNLIFNVPGGGYANVVSVGAANYLLTATNGDGSTTSLAMFMLVSPGAFSDFKTFAPVVLANGSDFGGIGTSLTPEPPNYTRWAKNTNYTTGTPILDSNGFAQIANNNGASGDTEPTWAALGDTTTETTGLEWENTGQVYPSTLRQTGFGPLWNRPNSSVKHGFESMIVPDCVKAIPAYQVSTAYSVGQIVSIAFNSAFLGNSGIICFECFLAGTTGTTDPTTIEPYSMNMMRGELIPDASFNPGGAPVWKVMGSLTMTLNWVGTQIDAPDGYSNNVTASGVLNPLFDGTVQSYSFGHTVSTADDIAGFLAAPASFDSTYSGGNTAGIPTAGQPVECPTWNSIGLDTGYINIDCADGFDANLAGIWAEFSIPYTLAPDGTITVVKATVPTGLADVFSFTSDYGSPFSLSDGQSNDSAPLAAGTYSVTETPKAGFTTTTDIDPSAIVLGEHQSATVTFTNTFVGGSIVVHKVTDPPGSPQVFTFIPSWGDPFPLVDGESHDSGPLPVGVYTLIETPVAGWLAIPSSNPLAIVVSASEPTDIIFTNRKQSGYLLARDLNTWGDRGTQGDPAAGDADLYTQCFVNIGSMQLSTPGAQLMEVRHIVGYFDAVGTLNNGGPSIPSVAVLPNEIAAINGAQFIPLPDTVTEPPTGATPSRSLQQWRWPLMDWSNDQTSLLMHHLQVKIMFAPENAKNTIKMIAVKSDQE